MYLEEALKSSKKIMELIRRGDLLAFTDDMLVDVNPELVGLAPVPVGPGGRRASELNAVMCGIFSGAARKGPATLEAAGDGQEGRESTCVDYYFDLEFQYPLFRIELLSLRDALKLPAKL